MIDRRTFLRRGALAGASLVLPGVAAAARSVRRPPNFLIVFCDDLGYGDIHAMSGSRIRTPNLDRMARDGVVLTDCYAAANLCTPSRAGLLTGRYPIRTGLAQGVILQNDRRGLPESEVTIFEALKPEYATALIGKWHLGHVAPHWPPTKHGIDLFFGLPYSHDMKPLSLYESNGPGVELTQEDVDYPQLQQRFCARAERFIEDNRDRPWIVDLSLSSPHLPNYPEHSHTGRSDVGPYGDTVVEIDAIVGRLNALLKRLGLERDTLVILTSDNGPWFEGSAGPLRQRKGGGAYDGGYRVPFIARQPGALPAGRRVQSIAMLFDLFPTFCAMAGKPLPAGVAIDGRDLGDVLRKGAKSPHDELVLFEDETVVGIRTQRWKYVIADYYKGYLFSLQNRGYPQLYDMAADPSESYSVARTQPDVLKDLMARYERARAEFEPLRTVPAKPPFTPPAGDRIPD